MDSLNENEIVRLRQGHCPVCDHRGFILGPRGGTNSMNIECGNLECRARFNIAQASTSHRIIWAERIPSETEGGPNWGGEWGPLY